jgi:hypothetical protein
MLLLGGLVLLLLMVGFELRQQFGGARYGAPKRFDFRR